MTQNAHARRIQQPERRPLNSLWLVVADATKARIFSTEPCVGVAGRADVRLIERSTVVNSERMVKLQPPFTKRRSEVAGQVLGGQSMPDDHREPDAYEIARRFSEQVAGEVCALINDGTDPLVICAGSQILGPLRHAIGERVHERRIIEHPVHLANLTSAEILSHLRPALL